MNLRKTSNIFYTIWGVIHVGVGASTGLTQLSSGSRAALEQMSEILPPETLPQQIPNVVDGVLAQHSWNLIWIGLLTIAITWLNSKPNNPRWTLIAITTATEIGLVVSLSTTGFETLFPIIIGPIIWFLAVSTDAGHATLDPTSNDQPQ